MLETFMNMFGLGDLGMGSVVMLFIGACLGWAVPQPAFAKPIVDMICDKFGLDRFHSEGHKHSDGHEAEEEKKD